MGNDGPRFKNSDYQGLPGKNFTDIFGIALVFMLAGFVMGLLFAPRSGMKTRKVLMDKIAELADRGKFTVLEARVMGEEFLEKSKEKIEKVSSMGSDNK